MLLAPTISRDIWHCGCGKMVKERGKQMVMFNHNGY